MIEKIKFYDVEQNSEEWDPLRIGKFTASCVSNLFMAKTTKGYQDEIIRVAYERVTGESQEKYSNGWMKMGHEKEPFAAENYELVTFRTLENGGFYELNDFVGASPDRKIFGMNGGTEFKCPSFSVYNEFLETSNLPKTYFWQIHHQLLCTGWDFIDYMPYMHPNCKLKIKRVERDEKILNQLREQLEISINEVNRLMERIKS
jgi:hypothetical protein